MKKLLSAAIALAIILTNLCSVSAQVTNGPVRIIGNKFTDDGTRKIVTVELRNNGDKSQLIGVGVIGYDSAGNALEARGGSQFLDANQIGEVQLVFEAGNKIADFEVMAGDGTNDILGHGSYLNENTGKMTSTIIVGNWTGEMHDVKVGMISYDTNGNILEAKGNSKYIADSGVEDVEIVFEEGTEIATIKGCVIGEPADLEIVGYGARRIGESVVLTSLLCIPYGKVVKCNWKLYGHSGAVLWESDLTLTHNNYRYEGIVPGVPDGLEKAEARFFDESGREITKHKQLIYIKGNSGAVTAPGAAGAEYVYDAADPGEGVILPADKLADVKDAASAAEAVASVAGSMTGEQKASATGVDRITLFAEEAVAQAASKTVTGSEIVISKGSVDELTPAAEAAKNEAEKALSAEGITTAREIDAGVKFKTDETKSVTVKIEPEAANVKADNVYVETPEYAIALSADALKTNVGSSPLVITVTEEAATTGALQPSAVAAAGYAARKASNEVQAASIQPTEMDSAIYPVNLASADELTGMMALASMDKHLGEQILFSAVNSKSYKISFNKPVSENIKISLTPVTGETAYQAVMNSKGSAVGGKYNPATGKLDVKIKDSDTFTVKYNKKDFSDIQKKSKEMQEAITVLASKGIIGGTGGTSFSPDAPITRSEIAALILRTLSKLDANANGGFTDVKKSDWYYGAAGSAKKHGIVKGTNAEGTLFSPKVNITKDQIVAISARTLSSEMKYKAPKDVSKYLGTYTDSSKIPGWGKGDIALATRENLVVRRSDGMFAPSGTMTRGDAAIILYRMFNKIW